MLESLQIMSGFKDIRSTFRIKCKIAKPLSELALWFTFANDLLSVHDMEDHKISMIIAIRKSMDANIWLVRLDDGSSGAELVKEAINENKYHPNIYLNYQYNLRGQVPFRLLK